MAKPNRYLISYRLSDEYHKTQQEVAGARREEDVSVDLDVVGRACEYEEHQEAV